MIIIKIEKRINNDVFYNYYYMDFYNNNYEIFSKSRVSIWSSVKLFIDSLPSFSTILDAGCGNCKNMYRNDLIFTGIDNSRPLLEFCNVKYNNDLIESSITSLPFKNNIFEYTISIAVIHHIESFIQRATAFEELLRVTSHKILISIWNRNNNRFYDNNQKIGDNNALVKWKIGDDYQYRFYHFFDEDEIIGILNICKQKYNFEYKITTEQTNYYIMITKIN